MTLNVGGKLSIANGGTTSSLGVTLDSMGCSTINAGTVSILGLANFSLSLGRDYRHVPGTQFVIMKSTAGSFTGTFANVADGDTITADGKEFVASYDNSSFTLTATGKPSAVISLVVLGSN